MNAAISAGPASSGGGIDRQRRKQRNLNNALHNGERDHDGQKHRKHAPEISFAQCPRARDELPLLGHRDGRQQERSDATRHRSSPTTDNDGHQHRQAARRPPTAMPVTMLNADCQAEGDHHGEEIRKQEPPEGRVQREVEESRPGAEAKRLTRYGDIDHDEAAQRPRRTARTSVRRRQRTRSHRLWSRSRPCR